MTKTLRFLTFSIILLISSRVKINALSYTDIESTLGNLFGWTIDDDEGVTSFRTLLIPFGGRPESMGSAFTGLCDDISFLKYNPAGSCVQKQTEFALFHNSWIADSNMETLAYTIRTGHFGFGAYISSFYVPFSEYNLFGERVAGNYYSETTGGVNFSYNFLAGYTFKGFALGTTIKTGWRSIPSYTDNDTNELIPLSGFSQSGLALMADAGLIFQFNFLKFYASRDPNLKIGISAQNIGVSFTGAFKNLQIDDPLPTLFSAGISYRIIKPFIITFDYKQPVNLFDIKFQKPYFCAGFGLQFTNFLSLLGGFEIKGGNPKISAGLEFEIAKIRFNMNYTLDMTTSLNPLNKFSLSLKLELGDMGRAAKSAEIDRLYAEGLKYYTAQEWEKAIKIWEEVLKLDKRFDPAKIGITSAQYQINMFKMIEESLKLD